MTQQNLKALSSRQHHGIVTPLFALHSSHSCGIGEYPDLLPLCTWCREIGFDIIQLLPLNDTGKDTSPYSALSANALNPVHLGLSSLPFVGENRPLAEQIAALKQWNRTDRVSYAPVQEGKEHFLRAYYQQYKDQILAEPGYGSFCTNNPWLLEYALFKALKIKHNWQNWEAWPAPWRDPTPGAYMHLPSELEAEIAYHLFVQYLCDKQFREVKQRAAEIGVFLKGDIPILINRESDAAWFHRELFDLQMAAGAPPDMYSQEGQKWGFPIYDWTALDMTHYRWWLERLAVASRYYQIYRLDHIVGFFRIWAIPKEKPAKEGYYVPNDPTLWLPQGTTILKALLADCHMLPIGEDLGTVPPEVRRCLHELGICGTKVMRWERRWQGDKSFIPPAEYPPDSMTTISTHDSETAQQWWENHPEEARAHAAMQGWEYSPQLTQRLRLAMLHSSHHSGSQFHINLLQEYLALIPEMVSANPADERINLPGIVSERNWTYRLKPSVEEISAHRELKMMMQSLLSSSSTPCVGS